MELFSVMKSKIFVSYLLSFLALVLLPLSIISIVITSSFNTSAQQQYLETEQLRLRAVTQQIDSYAARPMETASKLIQLQGFERFRAGTALTAYERQDSVAEVSRYLNGLVRSDICTDYSVYFQETDAVISSRGSTYSFLNYYAAMLNYDEMTGEAFCAWVESVERYAYSDLLTTANGLPYFCQVQVLPSSYLNRTSYLLSFFSVNQLRYALEQNLADGNYYSVRTPEGTVIVSTLPQEGVSQGDDRMKIQGVRYLRFTEVSSATGMEYTFYIPEATVFEALLTFQKIFWLVFAVVLLGSVVLAFILSLQRYAPIKNLFAQTFPDASPHSGSFELMAQHLTELNDQGRYYIGEIQAQYQKLRSQILIQILTTSDFDEKKLRLLLNEYKLEFPHPRFFIIVADGCPAEELDLPGVVLCSFPMTSYSVLIVNDSEEASVLESVCNRLEALQAARSEMYIRVSSPCNSLKGLHSCFREALGYPAESLAVQPAELFDEGILSGHQSVFYPVDKELEILNTLSIGDYEGCERLLTELYEANRSLPAPVLCCLLYSMTATACHVYYSLGTTDNRPFQYLESILACSTSDQHCFRIVLQFYQAVASLCRQPLNNKSEYVVSAVIQYIHQHYADPNLSLNAVANAFNVSYYYLSHIFSGEVHQSFSNLLNICRVEHAKRLLSHSEMTMQEVAVAVGYANSSTFFRTFRKMTGVTPKEYRIQQKPS